jgi:hypothetical protein
MIVFKIVLALLSLWAFFVLVHYLIWEIHNGRYDAKWRNNIYIGILLIGFFLVAYGGVKQVLFFIPDSWHFNDEHGGARGVKENIAGFLAFLGSFFLLNSFGKLSESSSNETHLKDELEKTKQNHLEKISKMDSDHYAEYKDTENEILELRKNLESKTKKCDFLTKKCELLPRLYHETNAFHIQEISHINQISDVWAVINREFTKQSLSDLSAKAANLLSTGKLNRDKATRDLGPLLQLCEDISCEEHDEVYAYVDKTSHPYSDKIMVTESILGLIEAFYINCLFPYDLYKHVNGDEVGRCIVTEDDAVQHFTLVQKLLPPQFRPNIFDRVWGLRIKNQSDGTIVLSCLIAHETFTKLFFREGEVKIKQGQIIFTRKNVVAGPITTKFVS